MKKKYIVVISGASGVVYAKHLLSFLSSLKCDVYVMISDVAKVIWRDELDENFINFLASLSSSSESQAEFLLQSNKDLASICASGSLRHDGLMVAPCSMKTLSALAHGTSMDLIGRTIDVAIKEGFQISVLLRETPFSLIHIENMRRAVLAGVKVVPANPAFYHKDYTIQGMVNFVVGKLLDSLDIEHTLYRRWKHEN